MKATKVKNAAPFARVWVFVVSVEYGGPTDRGGDGPDYSVYGVCATRECAERLKAVAIAENESYGKEFFTGENGDTWAFDVHIEKLDVLTPDWRPGKDCDVEFWRRAREARK